MVFSSLAPTPIWKLHITFISRSWSLVSDGSETSRSLARYHLLPFGNYTLHLYDPPSRVWGVTTNTQELNHESLLVDVLFMGSSLRVVSSLVYDNNHGGERGRTCVIRGRACIISLDHPRCSSDRSIPFGVDKERLIER